MSSNRHLSPHIIEQHKRRLSWMPWLFFSLKQKHLEWAIPWQQEIQRSLMELETIEFAEGCFVSPDAQLFAEPGRLIRVGRKSCIAAHAFLHGPITLGENVSVNHRCSLDGGAVGLKIGNNTRIGPGTALYAFDHRMEPEHFVCEQSVRSAGIVVGEDVWIGANCSVTDGVHLGDHCVVGMGAVVTRSVDPWDIVGGSPAKKIGSRKMKG
jgi:acetyltransferase-like isoleucine patch superfamily enzyme